MPVSIKFCDESGLAILKVNSFMETYTVAQFGSYFWFSKAFQQNDCSIA